MHVPSRRGHPDCRKNHQLQRRSSTRSTKARKSGPRFLSWLHICVDVTSTHRPAGAPAQASIHEFAPACKQTWTHIYKHTHTAKRQHTFKLTRTCSNGVAVQRPIHTMAVRKNLTLHVQCLVRWPCGICRPPRASFVQTAGCKSLFRARCRSGRLRDTNLPACACATALLASAAPPNPSIANATPAGAHDALWAHECAAK